MQPEVKLVSPTKYARDNNLSPKTVKNLIDTGQLKAIPCTETGMLKIPIKQDQKEHDYNKLIQKVESLEGKIDKLLSIYNFRYIQKS